MYSSAGPAVSLLFHQHVMYVLKGLRFVSCSVLCGLIFYTLMSAVSLSLSPSFPLTEDYLKCLSDTDQWEYKFFTRCMRLVHRGLCVQIKSRRGVNAAERERFRSSIPPSPPKLPPFHSRFYSRRPKPSHVALPPASLCPPLLLQCLCPALRDSPSWDTTTAPCLRRTLALPV